MFDLHLYGPRTHGISLFRYVQYLLSQRPSFCYLILFYECLMMFDEQTHHHFANGADSGITTGISAPVGHGPLSQWDEFYLVNKNVGSIGFTLDLHWMKSIKMGVHGIYIGGNQLKREVHEVLCWIIGALDVLNKNGFSWDIHWI